MRAKLFDFQTIYTIHANSQTDWIKIYKWFSWVAFRFFSLSPNSPSFVSYVRVAYIDITRAQILWNTCCARLPAENWPNHAKQIVPLAFVTCNWQTAALNDFIIIVCVCVFCDWNFIQHNRMSHSFWLYIQILFGAFLEVIKKLIRKIVRTNSIMETRWCQWDAIYF